jgi:hypothetical protein
MSLGDALQILPTMPGGSFISPEMQAKIKEPQEALKKVAAERGRQVVDSVDWELKPGAPPPSSH